MKLFATFLLVFGFVLLAMGHKIVPRQVTPSPGASSSFTKLSEEQVRHLQERGFGPTVPSHFGENSGGQGQGFRPTAALVESEDEDDTDEDNNADEDVSVASSQNRPAPRQNYNTIPINLPPPPQQQHQRQFHQQQQQAVIIRRPVQQQQYRPQQYLERDEVNKLRGSQGQGQGQRLELEEEEKEEPDRLTILLQQSHFDCNGKNGYYADEELNCEVFHYCQDNAKHSWICPEGFTFHQVHLICMPPSGDNICAKSSQFHFVNDFLYKPINLEEHQSKPNISLKYSDRYYPENFHYSQDNNEEEDNSQAQQYHHQQRKPIRVGLNSEVQAQQVIRRPVQQQQQASPSSPSPLPLYSTNNIVGQQQGQVFRSPEEVNISLQQRRPQFVAHRYVNRDDIY